MISTRFFFASLFVTVMCQTTSAEDSRPNLIHVIVDDLGWNDVGFHGSEIKTPNMDRLAADSVVLDRFYVTPICSPTRAGALTGRYPFRFGIWGGVVSPTKRHGLPPREFTAPELLAKSGYRQRIMLGKWHLGLASTKFHPLNHGFTEFYGHYNGAIDYFSRERFGELDWHHNFESVHEEGYSTDLIGKKAVSFIDEHSGESPFYMVIAFNAPHSPIQAKRADLDRYEFIPGGPRAPNTDRGIAKRENAPEYGERGKGNTVRQTFSAMVSCLDENIGRILDALDRHQVRDNTLLILHSDNGGDPRHGGNNTPLRGTKFTTWEGGVRVVAMVHWPKVLQGGRQYDAVASYVDVLPTLLGAIGEEVPGNLDGIDLLPFLQGDRNPPDRTILLDKDTIVSNRWKLKGDSCYDLIDDPNESEPSKDVPLDVSRELLKRLADFPGLVGPPVETRLPKPESWPPSEWRLAREPSTLE